MNEWVGEWMDEMVKRVKKLHADHQGVLLGGIG